MTTSTRWGDVYNHLESEGFEVYPPGIKVGECTKPYVVPKLNGSNRHPSFSTDVDYLSILCYVPKQSYSTLESYVQSIKKSMKELEPMILPIGYQTPSFYDDSVQGHMVSIEYKNYKKML